MNKKLRWLGASLVALSLTFAAPVYADDHGAKPAEREQISWDLTDLYPSDEAWEAAFEDIKTRMQKLERFKDNFGKNAKVLADQFQEQSDLTKDFYRMFIYASLQNDEDQRDATTQERRARVSALAAKFGELTAWQTPALLDIGEKKLRKYLKQEEGLADFDKLILDVVRQAPHTLDAEGEQMLAAASQLTNSPSQIYQMIANADIPWQEITLSEGEPFRLDQSAYTRARSAANRDDRKKVFEQFFGQWKDFEDSLGATLNTEVQANVFQAKSRKYGSVLEKELAQENLPEAVYKTLVAEVNKNLPTLHRYFKLRGKILGIDDLKYYDIYPPLVEMETDFGIEASKAITLEVLQPLGEDYMKHLRTALDSNWAHVYPQEGKRSGAYMNGSAYDVHPYVLLNHNDDYNALSTYAHEWGHAVHSMLAQESQPFSKAFYSTFTAEIASTINEILLEEHLIKNAKSKEEKLFYLGQALESIRGTFYRQTMFAEFELAIHEAAEAGKPLTGAIFSQMYGDLLKKYHGHDEGVLTIDEPYDREWMYIPHFYYDMYVFQYATSISGAAWFAEKFLAGDEATRDAFIDSLRAGGSDYAYNILKDAGLDMAKPEAYQPIVRRMEDIMDRIEAVLAE